MNSPPKAKLVKLKSGETYQRLLSEELGTCGIKSGHVILNPGESVGEHITSDREEVVVILEGKGVALINRDEEVGIEADSVLYVPPQTLHDIKNSGDKILEYIFVTAKNI